MSIVKVQLEGERFWIKKIGETKLYITGIVLNNLINGSHKFGDKIRIKKSNITSK